MFLVQKNKIFSIIIGFAISFSIFYMITINLDISKVSNELQQANLIWLLPNAILIIGSMYLRAWRWKGMLDPIHKVSFKKLLSSTSIGFMANNILPFRVGEIIRAYSLSKQEKNVSNFSAFATIFSERIVFDLLALLILFSIFLRITNLSIPVEVQGADSFLLVITIFGVIISFLILYYAKYLINFIDKRIFFLSVPAKKWTMNIIEKVALGLKFLKNPWAGLIVVFQTILIWSLVAFSNVFIFMSLGLDLPLEAAFTTLIVVSVMVIIPSSPGFIGVYHAGVKLTLEQYGVSSEMSFVCSILMHASQYIVVTFMGFYYMWKSHLYLSEININGKE